MESELESRLVTALAEVGVKADICAASNGEYTAVVALVAARRARFQLIARFEDDGKLLSVTCVGGCRVPTGAIPAATSLANRVNAGGLKIGSLCVDSDGDLLFRASSFMAEGIFESAAQTLLAAGATTLDLFEPAFFSLVYANTPPDEAYANAFRIL